MQAIRTENLHKEYKDVTAVKSLNLAVEEGELFSLLGVNGAGKTTTIKMLSCLTKPTSGDAFLMGKSIVRDAAEVKSVIGVSPQETAVAPNLTVEENLRLMCGIHGFDKAKTGTKVTELAARFGLDSVMHKKAGKLSGGWQRRLSIAMALISEPKILFLDEPTTYLDIRYQIEILQLVKKLNQEFGITIIMVLHDINQAIAYSDNVIGMKDGKVLVEGDPEEVITEESIRELYGIELGVTRVDGRKFVLAV